MQKHEKAQKIAKRVDHSARMFSEPNTAVIAYQAQMQQEHEVEKILSPFWAWRALTH